MKFKTLLISLVILLCVSSNSLAQEKINLSAGFGILELANIGIRYQFEQAQIGLSLGTFPLSRNRQIYSVLGDLFLHLGGSSELSKRKPWYIRFGLVYLYKNFGTQNHLYINSRLGREFNISKKVGLYIDFGGNINLVNSREDNIPEPIEPTCCQGGPYEYTFIPAVGAGIFYRF